MYHRTSSELRIIAEGHSLRFAVAFRRILKPRPQAYTSRVFDGGIEMLGDGLFPVRSGLQKLSRVRRARRIDAGRVMWQAIHSLLLFG